MTASNVPPRLLDPEQVKDSAEAAPGEVPGDDNRDNADGDEPLGVGVSAEKILRACDSYVDNEAKTDGQYEAVEGPGENEQGSRRRAQYEEQGARKDDEADGDPVL